MNAVIKHDIPGRMRMERIRFNYRAIVGFNTGLIVLGLLGIFPPGTSALLHNASTIAIGLKSTTKRLEV